MDDREFKKHLKDLAHGKHHPEEHDWAPVIAAGKRAKPRTAKRAKPRRTAHAR